MDINKVTITLDRYEELIRKETVFEVEKRKIEASSYPSEGDKALYGIKGGNDNEAEL